MRRIVDFFLPRHCVVCGERLAVDEHTICTACNLSLTRTHHWLSPTNNAITKKLPGIFPVEKAAAYVKYIPNDPLDNVVKEFKYHHNYRAAIDAGYWMGSDIARQSDFFSDIDCLVPVPLVKKRRRQRGYNQAEMLCRGIKKALDELGPNQCSIVTDVLLRNRFVQSQTTLDRLGRLNNVEEVFYVEHTEKLVDKHVLLVDDIFTVGATSSACAIQLRDIPGIRLSVLTYGMACGD